MVPAYAVPVCGYEPVTNRPISIFIFPRTRERRHMPTGAAYPSCHHRELFSEISHAFQTPLTVLHSGIELLRQSAHDSASATYASMERSIDELSRLTRSMLELARIDAQLPAASPSVYPLSTSLLRLTEYVGIIAETSGIRMVADVAPDIHVCGMPRQLEEAFTNILSNAVKYTASCETRRIRVSAKRDGRSVQVCVRDSGIGIRARHLSKLGCRFFRADRDAADGTGLGLAIARRIIAHHGGALSIKSRYGKGTTVRITLPCVSPEADRRQTPPSPRGAPQA